MSTRKGRTALATLSRLVLVGLLGGAGYAAAGEPVADPPAAAEGLVWAEGVTELSGAYVRDDGVASGLLAGEAADCRVSVRLQVLGTDSGTIGVVFGYKGPQNLWLAGFSPAAGRFELVRQSPQGPEVVASEDHELEPGSSLSFELRVKGPRAAILAGGQEVVGYEAESPLRGQVGIGSVRSGYDVLVNEVKVSRPDGTEQFELGPGVEPRWTPFRAPGLTEGTGDWGQVRVLRPGTEAADEGPRAAMLLDPATPGPRYRQEVEVRNGLGVRGLGASGVVFGYRDREHYNLLGFDPEASRIALWHRSPAGFEPLGSAQIEVEGEWLAFGLEVEGDRLRVQAGAHPLFDLRDDRFSGGRAGIASFGVTGRAAVWRRTAVTAGGAPLPPKEPDDLLAMALGARVVFVDPPDLPSPEALIDHPIGGAAGDPGADLRVEGVSGPLTVVFTFPHGRLARVEGLGARLAGQAPVGPVRFAVSRETPLTGFKEVGTLSPQAGATETVAIDPVTAKYLRVELPEAAAKEGRVAEVYASGSLLDRAVPNTASAPPPTEKSDLQEQEPNDTPERATRLPPEVWVGGSTGLGDVDHFRLTLPPSGGRMVLSGRTLGMTPVDFVLLDPDGREAKPATADRTGPDWSATYELAGGAWYLRATSAPLSLTVLFDDSGSMGGARKVLTGLLKGLASRVGPGLRIKLMKYAEAPVEVFDFVDDPAVLRKAIEREVHASGGTETLAGLKGGLDSLKGVTGNRALLVALDMVDGYVDPQQYHAFWRALVDTAAPVYVVGLGYEDWDNEYRTLGLSDRNLLSEVAWASRGRFLINPTLAAFEQRTAEILSALSSAAPYQVRALFQEGEVPAEPKGQGSLRVVLAPGAEKERVRTVELVLDASNSMWGQVEGRSKIEIAREALRSVVEGLPEGVHLGLRIYGHRWPRTDARACADSELVIPIGPLDRAALLRQVQGVTPRGRTPLVYSLQQTPNDFQGLPRGTVILVSDGIESCDGRLEDIVQAVRRHGLDLTVHIVGFDIRERGARAELERLARALGGRYFDAAGAGQLGESLERTLRLEYEVLDAKGAVAARGLAGADPVTLVSGEYTLRVLLEPTPVESRIRVAAGTRQALTLSRRGGRWHLDGQPQDVRR